MFKQCFRLTMVLACTALTPIAAPAQSVSGPSSAAQPLRVTWPQDSSDIKPDPSARFGRLPNGMTYLIYKNATPAGTASIHMRFLGGSLVEDENQRGLAHFVEHMAFEGSKNIPENQLVPLLQRHGFSFGADVNAFTLPNKTEYKLDLPKTDDDTVDTALMIMRETAGNLLIPSDALERERGVVLGEERLRDSPAIHNYKAWLKAAFGDQKYATRGLPIGLANVIQTAPRQSLVDYYNAFYRPELATLVVVGDIDPNAIEARIKARFSDWQPVGPAKTVDFGAYQPKGPRALAYAEKGLPDTLALVWFKPFDDKAQTQASEEGEFDDIVLMTILNKRFQHMTQDPKSTFVGAGILQQPLFKTAKVLQLSVVPKPGKDKEAFADALSGLKQFATYGVNQDEIDLVVADLSAGYQNQATASKTRSNGAILENFISNLDANSVFTSPEQDLADFNGIKPRLTSAILNARLTTLLSGDGPLILHSAEDTSTLDEAAMKLDFTTVMSQSVAAYQTEARKEWPYTAFGTPVQAITHKEFKDLGFTQYVYPNGLKVNIKTTTFKTDQIKVNVRFEGGLLRVSPATKDPVFAATLAAAIGEVFNGGLGKLKAEDIKKSLAGKAYGVGFAVGDDAANLGGDTTKADFATQMQVLMAFTTDSAFRPEAYAQIKAYLPNIYASIKTNPSAMLGTQLGSLMHPDDARFAFPTLDDMSLATNDQIKSFIQGAMKDTPIEITIVGDISADEALAQVSKTFGTLPALPKTFQIAPGAEKVTFPTNNLDKVVYHQGRADQSVSVVLFPLPDYLNNTQTSRGLELLTAILNQRLFEQVREQQGQAYDAHANRDQSYVYKNYGMLTVAGSIKAGSDKAFREALANIIADLQTRPVTDDELTRARKPLLEGLVNAKKDNQYWITTLPSVAISKVRLAAELSSEAELAKVTPADIQALAKTYLVDSKAMHVHVEPQPTSSAQK